MAFGLKRWAWLALLACALVAVAYLPPRGLKANRYRSRLFGSQLIQPTPARLRAQALAVEWRAAYAAARLVEQRRELGPALVGAAGDPGPALLFAGGARVPTASVARVAGHLHAVWRDLGLGETKIAVAVVIDLEGAGAPAGDVPREEIAPAYLFPDRAHRTLCLVRVPASRYWSREILANEGRTPGARLRQWLRSVLGPCAFFAAHGAPGRPVRRWLGGRQFDLALLPTWDAAPRAERDASLWYGSRWWWDYVYHQSPLAVGCLAGRETACRDAVLLGAVAERIGDSLSPVVALDRDFWRRSRLIGAARYLADVARAIGPERFREFWSSTLPVDSSLTLALRAPVGRWTAEWQLHASPRVRLGPAAPAVGTLLALLAAAAAVATVALAAQRRQVR